MPLDPNAVEIYEGGVLFENEESIDIDLTDDAHQQWTDIEAMLAQDQRNQ